MGGEEDLGRWGLQASFWVPQKLLISQIYTLLGRSKQIRDVFVDAAGRPIQHACVCGRVLGAEERHKYRVVTVDDATGYVLRCFCFENARGDGPAAATLKRLRPGVLVVVSGRLNGYRSETTLIVEDLYILADQNDEPGWFLAMDGC